MRRTAIVAVYCMSAILLGTICAMLASGNDCYAVQRVTAYNYVYAQPVVAYAAPLVYYSAGQNLINEANVEKIAQRIYQLQQQALRAPVKQGMMQQQVQAPNVMQQQVQAPLGKEILAPRQDVRAGAGAGAGAGPPASILALKCAECHSGSNPKKGIVIDGSTEMFCNQVTAAIRAIRDNRMPKGGPALSNAEKALALEELLALESRLPPIPTPEPEPGNDLPAPPVIRPRQDAGDLQ